MKVAGRTALVTGASRGIGRAIARAYVAEGARVVVTGRDAGALDALVAELGNAADAVPGDLAAPETPDSLAATLAHFGALDLLVNMQAASTRLVISSILTTGLAGGARSQSGERPHARSRRGAGDAEGGARPRHQCVFHRRAKGARRRSAYRVSTAALINLTEKLAPELAKHGIQVSCICPGVVDTEGYRD
jgi:NAD(P)-dependent dehydrogenase (short-subunit alcohol dehydrogenase family)